jgi:uncharacterized membrane protein (UPF0127 family)
MRFVRLINGTRDNVLCDKCGVADNMFTRVRGLLGKSSLPVGEGLLIIPCPSIHMFGMKFALDVIFLTKENIITDFVENIAPGKFYVAKVHHGKPHAAVELPVGVIAQSGTQRGDQLVIEQDVGPQL